MRHRDWKQFIVEMLWALPIVTIRLLVLVILMDRAFATSRW
jgi:hypothetical protein